MNIHYKLFKYGTFYSHLKDDARVGIFEFCTDPAINPGAVAISSLSSILLGERDPARTAIGQTPLSCRYGSCSQWPAGACSLLQNCLVLVICFLWRYLVRAWRRYPWKLVRAVDPAVPRTEREAAAKAFWDADDCELDSWGRAAATRAPLPHLGRTAGRGVG